MGDLIKSEYLLKADRLVEQAEDLMDSNVMIDTKPRYEGTCELYSIAADYFKISGKLVDSGNCLVQCAKLQGKLGNRPETAAYYAEAARLYRSFDPEESLKFYRHAIAEFLELQNFRVGARLQEEAAAALARGRAWGAAADGWRHAALLECWREAGHRDLRDNRLKFQAPALFLDACLALLADQDLGALAEQVAEMARADAAFPRSKEHLFVRNLVRCVVDRDLDALADHVYDFDNVFKLGATQIRMLAEVRAAVAAGWRREQRRRARAEAERRRKREGKRQ
eukprot:CAMPEP_0194564346 /NCGR_PEP_ID=MMETSP0292-20121207/4039_1 /TAXON_ID=39354 /ORGANISM="Heterosigma akashiwo, Strain CCMP2393" /LENGTH=281 /DNA_ID=CAMNT_0039413459 /DNA_START=133 /DNA_END=976 /DNA_ORIENTATION=+